MPTILTVFGLRVVVYPNDHRPAHVHVQGNGCEAVFNLACPHGPVELRENYSFSQKGRATVGHAMAKGLMLGYQKSAPGHYLPSLEPWFMRATAETARVIKVICSGIAFICNQSIHSPPRLLASPKTHDF